MKRRLTVVVHRVHVRAHLDQRRPDLDVPAVRRPVQRGAAALVREAKVEGAEVRRASKRLDVAPPARLQQRIHRPDRLGTPLGVPVGTPIGTPNIEGHPRPRKHRTAEPAERVAFAVASRAVAAVALAVALAVRLRPPPGTTVPPPELRRELDVRLLRIVA